MILYTINNVYPDKNFQFTVNAEILGLVPLNHPHEIDEIEDLKDSLNSKSMKNHTHQMLKSITIDDAMVTNEIEMTFGKDLSISVQDKNINFEFLSKKTNNITGLRNSNPKRMQNILKFYIGDEFKNDDDSEIIILKGDELPDASSSNVNLKIQHHIQHPNPITIDGIDYDVRQNDLEIQLEAGTSHTLSFNKSVKIDEYENDPELKDLYEANVQDMSVRYCTNGSWSDWESIYVDKSSFSWEFSLDTNQIIEIGFYTEVLTYY